ncbi:MAG: reverse transcriptase domain-containing protein, partial [Candidatus Fonsibacter sp.]
MQYGLRQNRGAADASHCVRRVVDKGESTKTLTILVLLDWERAFEIVSQMGLLAALARMKVDGKFMHAIGALYDKPMFDGVPSRWFEQRAVIRQGCPLSPYICVIFMTVLFADVHGRF